MLSGGYNLCITNRRFFQMKNLTRKISLLVALILCVTIGGVYAAWTYAGVGENAQTIGKGINLTTSILEGTEGSYTMTVGDVVLRIDQKATGDYTPVLQINKAEHATAATMTFHYTPTEIASLETEANCVVSYVSFSSAISYEGRAVFSFPGYITIDKVNGTGANKWVKQSSGAFSFTIDAETLAQYIVLNDGFYLDTKAKYDAFDKALLAGNIQIKISDKVPA